MALEGWDEHDGALERELTFASFPEAIAFVNRLAEVAEAENHHPDLEIHYRRVIVRWSTHSAGGITDRDRELAARTDELALSPDHRAA
jgi:4a-hydroxytetrahydrobiopterin dehydratase